MKCLNCPNEGVYDWTLLQRDFKLRNVECERFSLTKCFCISCFEDPSTRKLDDILFNYWLSIQPIEMKEETTLKYPTKEQYPKGYNWFAYDADGKAFFYIDRPFYRLDNDYWLYSGVDDSWYKAEEFKLNGCPTWKDSLQCKDDLKEGVESTKPNYYTWHPKVSCKEVSQEFMSNLGQAIQYIWRSNTLKTTKGQTVEELIKDLEKAQDFLGYEIQRLKEGK